MSPCQGGAVPAYVYVASPLGFTVPTRAFYEQVLLPAVTARGAVVLDPWLTSAAQFAHALGLPSGAERDAALRTANRDAGAANERMIRDCTAVFAVLDGVDVDSGTAAEIGFAAALGRPVVGWRSDFRLAGDNHQSLVNLQVEHFVTSLHTELEEALGALQVYLR
jgi:nucleoside 2-deoxyribosyltransferase